MVWFRVDDTFDFHPKTQKAGNKALGLWVRSGAFSARLLTEGLITYDMIRKLGGSKADVRALVEAGLWEDHPEDGGYRFHQWEQANPTKEKVLTERAATAERQRRARDRSRGVSRVTDKGSHGVTNGVSHGPPDPTRPVTTSMAGSSSSSHLGNAPGKNGDENDENSAAGPARWRIMTPPGAVPSGVDADAEWDRFIERNAGTELRDPRSAWLGWLRVAGERSKPTPTPGRPECPDHPGQPTGSVACPECAATTGPPPAPLRMLRDQTG
jgi:hypothetical protein